MEALIHHIFEFAESYTVLLIWLMVPLAGLLAYYRHRRWSRVTHEGRDAKDRRAA
ncbi:MAG: hypothetical protein HYR96_07505 [Deltaproteobacteria bacterium]|nr:hypothetical protein [Deltaproteobacteria bacterium]MBI3296303.1 hypothetical protein [Deltaproteobacteria bacterium]